MKYLFCLSAMFICSSLLGQTKESINPGEKVLIDNSKVKIIEYKSPPQGDVCGLGMHYHEPHLTIVLTDAKVLITTEDGKSQEVEAPAGTPIWFDNAETHSVINTGDQPTKMLLVYLKE